MVRGSYKETVPVEYSFYIGSRLPIAGVTTVRKLFLKPYCSLSKLYNLWAVKRSGRKGNRRSGIVHQCFKQVLQRIGHADEHLRYLA